MNARRHIGVVAAGVAIALVLGLTSGATASNAYAGGPRPATVTADHDGLTGSITTRLNERLDRFRDRLDLMLVKAAVSPYRSTKLATRAGWGLVPGLDNCFEMPGVGGMGIHYINTDLLDLDLNPLRPEALVYEPQPNGRLRLGAVEYIVPQAPWDAAHPGEVPVIHGLQSQDMPLHLNAALGVYVLHAWIFTRNPAGTFADWNPDVSCPPGTAMPHS